MDGFSPNAVRVKTSLIAALLIYVGYTTTDTKNTMTGLQKDVANLSKQLDKAQLDQDKFVPASVLNDKFSDLNRRVDKLETRMSLNEREDRAVPDLSLPRVVDGDDAGPRAHVKIIK